MKPIVKIIPTHSLHIVDENEQYAHAVKHSLEEKFEGKVSVSVFRNAETSLESIKKLTDKPHVVLMDHAQNKEIPKENGRNTIEAIQQISPDTRIVILSDEENKEHAAKALAHGASDFVIKDQFSLEHIFTAVSKCLYPTKV